MRLVVGLDMTPLTGGAERSRGARNAAWRDRKASPSLDGALRRLMIGQWIVMRYWMGLFSSGKTFSWKVVNLGSVRLCEWDDGTAGGAVDPAINAAITTPLELKVNCACRT